jgi:hypothetical protein
MGWILVSHLRTCHGECPVSVPDAGIVLVVVVVSRLHAGGQPFADKARLWQVHIALVLIVYVEGGNRPPMADEARTLLIPLVILFQRYVRAIHGLGGRQGILIRVRFHGRYIINGELQPVVARALRVDGLDVNRERMGRRQRDRLHPGVALGTDEYRKVHVAGFRPVPADDNVVFRLDIVHDLAPLV